jgi:hypothetical protein
LKRQAQAGQIELVFLDESGFAPTFPITYTWARQGVRPTVAYEAPEGRRVNVIGAFVPWAEQEHFVYDSFTHSIKAPHFLAFVWCKVAGMTTPLGELPTSFARSRPCVIVLDNYSVHKNKAVKGFADAFAAAGISFFFLPPYSPELNLIEPIWRHVKYDDIPVRSHSTTADLKSAVDGALDKRKRRLAETAVVALPHSPTPAHSTISLSNAA